jgi:hypothetical protein
MTHAAIGAGSLASLPESAHQRLLAGGDLPPRSGEVPS